MTPIAELIWNSKYRFTPADGAGDLTLDASWQRVAAAVAAAEHDRGRWQASFHRLFASLQFLPGGRILAGAGTGKKVTLFNCFVAGGLQDSMDSILDALKESAVTMQHGGGIGLDFSALRPAGSMAQSGGTTACGPVPFLQVWDSLCTTLLSTSSRRGAMMATLRCDHPDIEAYIAAKRQPGALTNFNLSVLVSDTFMQAVADNAGWPLVFPAPPPGERPGDACPVHRVLPARDLWHQIAVAAHESGEPGVLFVDRVNRENNLYYCETISATNPCGEVPLPPFGACDLGSINLPSLVSEPFTPAAAIREDSLLEVVGIAVRFLDDVIDVSGFPLPQQAEQARATRRIGLGITGLADMLAMLGMHYDSDRGRATAAHTLGLIRDQAYITSTQLAQEKGAFPRFDPEQYLAAPFIRRLGNEIRARIAAHGLRNSHLLAIAPAGTISLLADNVSSGIEPIFALEATRMIRGSDLQLQRVEIRDYAYARWLDLRGDSAALPAAFVTAETLPAQAHLAMQCCLQACVDGAISKTINLREAATAQQVQDIFLQAYISGIKGCTVFREGSVRGQVLEARNESHCCPAPTPDANQSVRSGK
jgi:ribonucleoside-diphosphate reductase alpha chain